MSADKRENVPGRDDPENDPENDLENNLENEFRAMFAERSETVRPATSPYAAVRQRIGAARRRRRMRIGGASVAFAVAVVGIGVWATVPDARHRAIGPASRGGGTLTPEVMYAGGRTEIPAGPLRDAALAWLRANYHGSLSGRTVVTTFDENLQTVASAKAGPGDSGVAVVDSRNGEVLALGGTWDRPLSIADTMKPLVLAAAFTTGHYTPDSTVPLDAQTHPLVWPPNAKQPMTYMGAHGKADWPPESPTVHIQDVDVTLRKAAEIGANGPFAQLGLSSDLGPKEVYDLATRMGIPSGTRDFVPVPSLILGMAEATPLTMATVYATLADGGVRHDPVMVGQLLGKDGRVVWTPSVKSEQVLSPSAAREVTDVLHSALTDGTTGTAVEPRTSAEPGTWAMAGAFDGAKAAWFDGGDSHYVISVAVSKTGAKGTLLPLSADGHNGPDVGSRLAGPIWTGMVQTLRNQG